MRANMRTLRGVRLVLTGVVALLVLLGLTPASATSANISHSYSAAKTIENGSIVSLDPDNSDTIQPASTANGSRLLGVVVASDDSLLAIDADVAKVQVATSGTATTLVTTLGGNINVGDQIAVSPFEGVGMKASPGEHVIGLAQTAFSSTSEGARNQSITSKDGKKTEVALGYVRVNIAVGTAATAGGDQALNGLQRVAKGLTGHTVSTLRIVISIIVATVALIALITLIYASIYGGIISIGRNPLAKYAVFRTMGSVVGMAMLTALIASLIIFFLLR